MTHKRTWLSLALVATLAACHHQTIETGLSPGSTVIDMPWVATWVFGIVPAQEIDVRNQCPGGVAVVETERSFLNGLVGGITFGIFTPVHVRITCASGSASVPASMRQFVVPAGASAEQQAAVLTAAVQASMQRQQSVAVRF